MAKSYICLRASQIEGEICEMLDQELPYKAIIAKMEKKLKHLVLKIDL